MILFIYEQNPESLDFYLIPEDKLPKKMLKWMKAANGAVVNCDDMDAETEKAANYLSLSLYFHDDIDDEDKYTFRSWEDGKVTDVVTLPKECRNLLKQFHVEKNSMAKHGQEIDRVFVFSFAL
jgi:hypothetical protein